MKAYTINEAFYSLQGEGARAGSANLFLRFSGCNLECDLQEGDRSPGGFACDTEFKSGRAMTVPEIHDHLLELLPESARPSSIPWCGAWVILTGGEPLLQVDEELVETLRGCGFHLALETNGTRSIPEGIEWVTVSPKIAEHALKANRANELKYVRAYGQGIPKPKLKAEFKYISPAWGSDGLERRTLDWCIRLVKENPEWRLSLQQHKSWRVR